MHIGEAQCRNVEFLITTPSASGVSQMAAPGPPAPPSRWRPSNVTPLDDATLMYAVVAAGTTARPLMTTRVEPSMFMPVIVAPGSPVSVRSASGPPRARIETVPYAPGAISITSPGRASASAVARSRSPATCTVAAPAAPAAANVTPKARAAIPDLNQTFTIGDANKLGPPQIPRRHPTNRRISGPTGRSTVPCWSICKRGRHQIATFV